MSQITPTIPTREPIERRVYLTHNQKLIRWKACNGLCQVCFKPVDVEGPLVIWDHRVALALGGSNAVMNFDPHHTRVCANAKTRMDRKAIAKAKRLEARALGTRRERQKIKGGGFRKDLRRRMNGKVELI